MFNKFFRIAVYGCFLNFLSFFFAGAQKPVAEQLKEKLRFATKKDTARIQLLNELARRSEIPPVFRDSLLNESIRLSQELNYPAGESFALIIKAQFVGELKENERLSRQAVIMAEKSGNPLTLFQAYRSWAEYLLKTSEHSKAIIPMQQALKIALATNDPALIIQGQLAFVDYYKTSSVNYPVALEWALKALHTAEQFHYTPELPHVYRNIGAIYILIGDTEKSLENLQKSLTTSRQTGNVEMEQYSLNDLGEQYRVTGNYPEALKAYGEAALLIKDTFNIELNQSNVADVYQRMGNTTLAFQYAFKALLGAKQLKDTIGLAWIDNIISRAYLQTGRTDSALSYAKEGYAYAEGTGVQEYLRDNSEALANAYQAKQNFKEALTYYKIFIRSRDSILNTAITNKAQLAQFHYDMEKKQTEIGNLNKDRELQAVKVQRQRLLLIGTIAILLLILFSLLLVYRNIRKLRKAYAQLHQQKQEIQTQRDQTNQALHELKLAQNQLIQSEKMASLGELTAGIAHEIQNPLNFVNNFSEVSRDLIEEMIEELANGNYTDATEIAEDVRQNLEKINHHGKRADAIIKGMLQHSRSSSGQKEPTDLNALCDEYLRLSYHGLRAKDKAFNAGIVTGFDPAIEKLNLIPQDMGRVILNLINNAFYAVNEKKKENIPGYEPTIRITTRKTAGAVELKVSDNGNGIPQTILDKIFQPFFTTKPTGQGTGLGLSLSYDIVTKGHSGELKVETKEKEGTVFLIRLPVTG